MSSKPVVLRSLAAQDVDQAVASYARQGGSDTPGAFISALEAATAHLALFPGAGSPGYSHRLRIPDLRLWVLHGFPYGLFYIELYDP